MAYTLKSVFVTLQGEGARAGRAAVLCRFTGCNLWSGREEDRGESICGFCDTDFVGTDGPGGGRFEGAEELAAHIRKVWDEGTGATVGAGYAIFTGGEPLLQLDRLLIRACRERALELGIETNGTVPVPAGIDWICVSPKAGAPLLQRSGDELKVVYPQEGLDPHDFEGLAFEHLFVQPLDDPEGGPSNEEAIEFCLKNPRWRLSLQAHKLLGLS